MKKFFTGRLVIIALLVFAVIVAAISFTQSSAVAVYFNDDPDIPDFVRQAKSKFSKEEYRHRREKQIELYRGMAEGDRGENLRIRSQEIAKMEQQMDELRNKPDSAQKEALLAAWQPIGPDPIPNGQTQVISTPVSGRVTAIDVHPTNPDIVYVGTAQGGLYRSINGGVTWTQLMQNAQSLAIGAVRIAPSQPETVYVGTGEPNFSSDSYFGVGIYRIDNASTTANLTGPIGNANFNGRSIAEILVHPTDPATIFVASASACAAINCGVPALPTPPLPAGNRGIWRSTNATSAAPTFAQLPFPFAQQNFSVRDIVHDPTNPNLLVAWVVANGGGVIVSNNAMNANAATVTFTQRVSVTDAAGTTSELNGELSLVHPVGAPQPTIYVATGNLGGGILRSDDGGVTFPLVNSIDFCTPQCFYDIAIAADPTNAQRVHIGGAPNTVFATSVTGGTTPFIESETGLHVDSHVITLAPSNPNIIYFGSDGGIYRSDNLGVNWTPRNTAGFLATQFMGLDNHPTDPNILIGGTQDNGTNRFTTAATWLNTDFGDGGYSVIDQSSVSNVTYNQYHTYFNASNLTGYAFSNNGAATPGTWTFRGCNNPAVSPRNGIFCTAVINFYAPLERGPGTPNSIYYGSDRLYRSVDTGANHTVGSQTFTSPLSAIGISPQNDNVRMIGLNNGGIFGTTTGANTLIDLDPSNQVPNVFVSRTVIHPFIQDRAFVTLTRFNAPQIYMTNNLSSFAAEGLIAPTWESISGTGLPQVPVNAFFVDPASGILYAGTDIGVYVGVYNNGWLWAPLGTGMPRIAVFDLEDAPGGILRAATHGQGIYQIPLLSPTAASVTVSGRVTANGRGVANAIVTYAGETGERKSAITNGFGFYRFEEVPAGQVYTFNVVSKRHTFAPKTITVSEDLTEMNFEAE